MKDQMHIGQNTSTTDTQVLTVELKPATADSSQPPAH
jgi:hypothetical protein